MGKEIHPRSLENYKKYPGTASSAFVLLLSGGQSSYSSLPPPKKRQKSHIDEAGELSIQGEGYYTAHRLLEPQHWISTLPFDLKIEF